MKNIDDKSRLIEHHTKYKELHGVDETVWMTDSEHKILHLRLRKEGKCCIPSDVLTKIARAAHRRTPKAKKTKLLYRHKSKAREWESNYKKENIRVKYYSKTFSKNTQFQERIEYNLITGNVSYSALFRGTHDHKLPVIFITG